MGYWDSFGNQIVLRGGSTKCFRAIAISINPTDSENASYHHGSLLTLHFCLRVFLADLFPAARNNRRAS